MLHIQIYFHEENLTA